MTFAEVIRSAPRKTALIIAIEVSHILFVIWFATSDEKMRARIEDYGVTMLELFTFVFYVIIFITAFWASKSWFNLSLGVQKFFWAILFGAILLPFQLWSRSSPDWLRIYVYGGLAISTPWVLYELSSANDWGGALWRRILCVVGIGRNCRFPFRRRSTR